MSRNKNRIQFSSLICLILDSLGFSMIFTLKENKKIFQLTSLVAPAYVISNQKKKKLYAS